jgi:hypothetical protein
VWLGSAAAVLVLVLAVLFLVFSGPQFLSLLQRAVVPFKPAEIATATTISIDEPEGGDTTVTDGQPLTIAVSLGGRIPNPDGPDKPRLLVRYNADSDETVEMPLTQAGSSKEFRIDLGRGTILNGFWYRVAAADARTAEHRVTTVTRPMLSEFKATYDYPAYLKWPADTESGTRLRALRGTTVTLTAKANRTVQSARLTAATVDGTRELVPGEVFGDGRDHVRFKLKLRESGTYRIDFKPTGPELSTATADYPIEVEVDAKPVVEITTPKEEEVQLPLNGTLAVDGTAKDDHGLARVELRFQLAGDKTVAIKPKAFRDGQPLVREQDGTHLTDLPDYKDSVKLDALTDADGKPLKLKEADVLEYWLAAIDNCTEPQANVGESARKKVRLTAAIKEPQKQQEQANRDQQRKQEEKNTEAKRDEQLKNEKRPEEQNRNPNKDPQQQPEKQPDGVKTNDDKDPMQKGEGDPQGKPDGKQGEGTPQDQEEQKKADDLKKKMEQQREQKKQEAGDARGDGDKSEGQETKPDAGTKPPEGKPGGEGSKGAAEGKEGPKPDDMAKPDTQPSEGKDGGRLADPERAKGKEPPKPDAKGEDKPTGDQPKGAPKEGSEAGTSKESKEQPSPQSNDPKEQKKDGSAGSGRGAEPPPQGDKPQDPMGNQGSEQPKGGSKPKGDPERGSTKPEPKGGDKGGQQKDAGEAKGEAPNKPAESKAAPQGNEKDPMSKKGPPPDAAQEKQPPKEGADGKEGTAEPKGEGPKPDKQPTDGGKGEEDRGSVKPSDTSKKPDQKDQTGNGEKQPDSKQGGNGEKQPDQKDPKQGGGKGEKPLDPKEMEQAVKDLESKDEKTKQAAQEKLDKAVGKENREQIEQMQKDLQSDDKAKREAAKQKLDEMAKNAQKGGEQQPKELTEQEKKDLIDAAKKLDSKDPQEKKAAQEKLDKAMGQENREKLEQMQKDLKSEDKGTREAAEKKVQEMAKQAQQGKQDTAQKPELTEEQKKELADAAQKLNSKDDAERQAAEQKLDDAIGKKNREELQQDLKDLQGNDPAKAEQARKKLEKKVEEAKNAKNGNSDKHDDNPERLGGGNSKTPGEVLKANLENQLKSEELKLDDFKKYRGDKKFLKDNDLTEEQFERFLKQQESAVQKLREQVAEATLNPKAEPTGPPTVGRNDFSKERVTGRGKADAVQGSGGPAVAPPGFADAVKRFSSEASKQSK